MKKYLLLIITCVFLFPILVLAEECKNDDIVVSKIELNEVRGNAEETSDPNNENNQINLNTKMNVIGDSLTYKVVIKNTSNSDYVFDKNQITKDYINYNISYEDNSNIVKSGEEKTIYLRLRYDSKLQVDNLSNGILQETNQVSFNLINEKGDSLINPETGSKIFYILLFVVLIISLIFIKSNKKIATMVIISLISIPQMVKAVCTCSLDINLNLEIDAKEAVFLPGTEVKAKMNDLKGGENIISSIKQSQNEPSSINKEEKNLVSTTVSPYPIYMWYEDGTIYWWSEDKTPSLNTNSSYMFSFQKNLTDISGVESFDVSSSVDLSYIFTESSLSNLKSLKNWNVSNVENLSFSFSNNKSLINLTGLENWNTSKVSDMQFLFSRCENLINMDAIKYWDVSKVNNMSNLFQMNFSIEKIDLSNWETKSLEKMKQMFAMSYRGSGTTGGVLKKILLSEKFDTSKVTDMSFSFYNNQEIEDYTFTKYMDTSSVTNMQDMFYGNFNLTSLEWFKDWDVSNVKNMGATFTLNPNLKTLNGIENWNVSNVENMSFMFSHCPLIEDASALNDWDISKVTDFTRMFFQAQDYPNFTKRQGTWQSNGTFTPTE